MSMNIEKIRRMNIISKKLENRYNKKLKLQKELVRLQNEIKEIEEELNNLTNK